MEPSNIPVTPHDPGTPDDDVPPMRLAGRIAARRGDKSTEPPKGSSGRTDWWLGWYDERLKKFYEPGEAHEGGDAYPRST